jgi:diaminohydroxyphosphoribosylaminopyrimidine deaminase/5-amino-6-(5-phosphoribosylamino)uracil reductase
MASTAEVDAMRRALAMAASAPRTHPNPRVGAVVLDADHRPVAEGIHRGAGQPHAEVEALRAAGEAARGGTAVVTLEPCCHTGRTGPCTEALLTAGVGRVVFGQTDPNPAAAGGGEVLRAAGVDVEAGVLADEAVALNPLWALAMRRRRPYVTWKVASTVDGRVAAPDRTSRWVTGPAARAEVHALRAQVDAVMVGTGTALADDPQLTVRREDGTPSERQPLRVVVGRRDVDASAHVADGTAETLHLRTHSPQDVLEQLFGRDVHHVLLEGGPTLAAAFLKAGRVDRAVGFLAPVLMGDGPAMIAPFGVRTLEQAPRFAFSDVRLVGDDVRWTAQLSSAPLVDLEGDR